MSDLPQLSKDTRRLHALQWTQLVQKYGFTGNHLKWHESPMHRRKAAEKLFRSKSTPIDPIARRSPPPSRKMREWLKEIKREQQSRRSNLNAPVVVDSIGVGEALALAQERFRYVVLAYMSLWAKETAGDSEVFAQWLDQLRASVEREVGELWDKTDWHSAWFDRACQPMLDKALRKLSDDQNRRVRNLEKLHLENPHLSLASIVNAEGNIMAISGLESFEETLRVWQEMLDQRQRANSRSDSVAPVVDTASGKSAAKPAAQTAQSTGKPGGTLGAKRHAHGETLAATSPEVASVRKKRGRIPKPIRREAIHNAIIKQGDEWRDHLSEIFRELDSEDVFLGDFLGREIDLGDGQTTKVSKWDDLDLAQGDQRKRIVDTLRHYL